MSLCKCDSCRALDDGANPIFDVIFPESPHNQLLSCVSGARGGRCTTTKVTAAAAKNRHETYDLSREIHCSVTPKIREHRRRSICGGGRHSRWQILTEQARLSLACSAQIIYPQPLWTQTCVCMCVPRLAVFWSGNRFLSFSARI